MTFCERLSSHLVELDPVLVRRTGWVIRGMKFNKRVVGFTETKCNKTRAVKYDSFQGHNRSSCAQGGLLSCSLVRCLQGESKCIII